MILNKKLENYWLILQSLPSWECGLKYRGSDGKLYINFVAPFVGVWIEILIVTMVTGQNMVAPFVGVWIEIISVKPDGWTVSVAPFVGVWIEIF